MADPKEVKLILKSTVIANPLRMTVVELMKQFKETVGYSVPFRELGFSDVISYLQSIPDTLTIVGAGRDAIVRPVVTEKTVHLVEMIARQKKPSVKKKFGRAPAFRQPPRQIYANCNGNRVRPSIPPLMGNFPMPYPKLPSNPHISNQFRPSVTNNHPNNLQNSTNNHQKQNIPKNPIAMQPNMQQPRNSKPTLQQPTVSPTYLKQPQATSYHNPTTPQKQQPTDDLISPKQSPQQSIYCSPSYQQQSSSSYQQQSSSSYQQQVSPSYQQQQSSPSYQQQSSPSYQQQVSPSYRQQQQSTSSHQYSKTILEEPTRPKYPPSYQQHESPTYRQQRSFSTSSDTSDGSEQLQTTPQKSVAAHSDLSSSFNKLHVSPPKFDLPREAATTTKPVEIGSVCDVKDMNYKVPYIVQDNMRNLMMDHPEGVRCLQFGELYKSHFRTALNPANYGYKSMHAMCSSLPYIFNWALLDCGDYMLYDKQLPLPELLLKERNLDKYLETPEPTVPALPANITDVLTVGKFTLPPGAMAPSDSIPKQTVEAEQGTYIDIRVGEVYDPSKFWFGLDDKYDELNKMMDDMQIFYEIEKEKYRVPEHVLQEHLYCSILFLNEYHRAIISNMMPQSKTEVKAFFIDFGTVSAVPYCNIYFLHESFKDLPAQAIRGRLARIYPVHEQEQWTRESASRFLALIMQRALVARIDRYDATREAFELLVVDTNTDDDIHINDTLVYEGHAKFTHQDQEPAMESSHVPIVKYIHFFPTFDELEMGYAPTACEMIQFLRTYVPLYNIYPQYYKVKVRPPPGFENVVPDAARWHDFKPETAAPLSPTGSNASVQRALEFLDRMAAQERTAHAQSLLLQQAQQKIAEMERKKLYEQYCAMINTSMFTNFAVNQPQPIARTVFKTRIYDRDMHVLRFASKPYLLISEVQKQFLDVVHPTVYIKRVLAMGHSVLLEDINLKFNEQLRSELLSYNLIVAGSSYVEVVQLKDLPEMVGALSKRDIAFPNFDKYLVEITNGLKSM